MSIFKYTRTPQVHAYRFPPLPTPADVSADLADLATQESSAESLHERYRTYFDSGLQQGLAQGHRQGLQQGQQDGYPIGLDEGRNVGREQAYEEAKASIAPGLALLSQLYQQLEQTLGNTLGEQREELCQLVSQVCRQVLRAELSLQPQQILQLIDNTLAMMPKPHGEVTIHLDPHSVPLIKELAPEQCAQWQLDSDSSLSPGSFRVTTARAEADSNLNERIDQAVERLQRSLEENGTAQIGTNEEEDTPVSEVPDTPAVEVPDSPIVEAPSSTDQLFGSLAQQDPLDWVPDGLAADVDDKQQPAADLPWQANDLLP